MVSTKIRRTLRINESLDKKIIAKAKKLGISVNAYITMVLSKECQE